MAGLPVVTVANGGLAVTPVASGGLPVTEAANGMGLAVTVVSGGAAGMGVTYEILVPTITLSGTSFMYENTAIGTTIGTLSVLFPNGAYTFSKTSDPDSAFTLTGTTLKNSFLWDYETKTSHPVTIQATNGVDAPISRTFTVLVGDIDEVPPVITVSPTQTVAENAAFSLTLTADKPVTWTKTGGADTALFTLAGSTLSMTAKDFEAPADANTDNAYVVQVTATSTAFAVSTNATITVTVTDVAGPSITSSATQTVAENSAFTLTLTASETVTWAKIGGADTALFTLSGATLSMTARDFESPADADANNTYIVQVRATSTATGEVSSAQTITVTVTDVSEGGTTPGTPTLTWTSDTATNPPVFSYTVPTDPDLAVGDNVHFQRAADVGFTASVTDYNNTVDSGEDAANALTFSSGTWALGTWYVRARTERSAGNSAWSNTETKTLVSTLGPPLTNLWGWWSADQSYTETTGTPTTTITADNTAIGSMLDRSGNARHLYRSGAAAPTFKTAVLNSLPGARYSQAGGNGPMVTSVFGPFGTHYYSIYVVCNRTASNNFAALVTNNDGPLSPVYLTMDDGAGNLKVYDGSFGTVVAVSSTVYHLVASITDNSIATVNLNVDKTGDHVASVTGGGNATGNAVQVGAFNNVRWTGDIVEILLYAGVAHSTGSGDGAAAIQYLNARYGLGF